jgi:GntR family transcriptional regulator, transcriptional repressor for pyruvate dehydrogenase complex
MSKMIESPKRKKSEVVAARIRSYITNHGLRSGDRLPTEGEFAERFGVSRVAVREATQALSFLGILDAAPRRGLTVGRVSMKRLSKYLGFHFAIGNYPVDELIDTRIVVETGGLQHVVRRMAQDPLIYEQLNELNNELRQARRLQDWIKTDIRFHCSLVSASGLRGLAALNDLLQVFFRRFREDFPRSRWNGGIEGHQQIIDALRDGDQETAVQVLTRHIESHRPRARMPLSFPLDAPFEYSQ